MNIKSLLLPLSLLAVAACAAPTASSNDPSNDPAGETSEDLSAGSDPVVLANAKTFFQNLVESNEGRDQAQIPYSELPARLAKQVASDNPHPKQEWAAEAFRAHVRNSKDNLVTIYGVMDGIDDEGEAITLYTTSAKQIAEGDDYRGFHWN